MTDTGPAYPPPPAEGSNAIGRFEIGVSPVGDIPHFDVWTTILSQYANSPILTGIIENAAEAIDQTENLNAFYDNIWNIASAVGYGLDVWGRIVGVERNIQVQVTEWFGFSEAEPGSLSFDNTQAFYYSPALGFAEGFTPFGQGSFDLAQQWVSNGQTQGGGAFYNGQSLTSIYALPDTSYRTLIYAKAAFNITNGSIPAINRILMTLFPGRGNTFVREGYGGLAYFGFIEQQNADTFGQGLFYLAEPVPSMTMEYVFQFKLSSVEYSIVATSGVLPKSTGVLASISIEPPLPHTVVVSAPIAMPSGGFSSGFSSGL